MYDLRGSPDDDDFFFSVNHGTEVDVGDDLGVGPIKNSAKVLNKVTLASVALLTETEAARVFNMGTTSFKARCV